ncbi:hypothetical protein QHH11_09910 [Aphanizomenon sp. PH219]|nr:hypothetical protein [Aphanizomenon sp. 202]MDK2459446.1 hypothetical protein [Aphanizomenon sp. PH219]
MQFSVKKLLSVTATGAAIFVTSASLTATPAHAGISEAGGVLKDYWGAIVSNVWSPWFKQVYMTSISPQETESVKLEYQSRAGGVLNDRCVNKVADVYLGRDGWMLKNTPNRWTIASTRVENGQANCYNRMPNWVADRFKNARGW